MSKLAHSNEETMDIIETNALKEEGYSDEEIAQMRGYITLDRVHTLTGGLDPSLDAPELRAEIGRYRDATSRLDRAAMEYDLNYLSYGAKTVWDGVVISLASLADARAENERLKEMVGRLRGALEFYAFRPGQLQGFDTWLNKITQDEGSIARAALSQEVL